MTLCLSNIQGFAIGCLNIVIISRTNKIPSCKERSIKNPPKVGEKVAVN